MIGIPFDIRPPAESVRKNQTAPPGVPDGFSATFTALMALVMKDGLADKAILSVIKDIYPFAEPRDRNVIESLLFAGKRAQRMKTSERFPAYAALLDRPVLSRTDRLLGMMRVLKKYASKETADMFTMIERLIETSRFMSSGPDPASIIMTMMPNGGMGDISGLVDIIKSLS